MVKEDAVWRRQDNRFWDARGIGWRGQGSWCAHGLAVEEFTDTVLEKSSLLAVYLLIRDTLQHLDKTRLILEYVLELLTALHRRDGCVCMASRLYRIWERAKKQGALLQGHQDPCTVFSNWSRVQRTVDIDRYSTAKDGWCLNGRSAEGVPGVGTLVVP